MKRQRTATFSWGAVALGIVLLAGAACLGRAGTSADAEKAPELPVKRVKVAAVESSDLSRQLRFAGVTRAARRANLSFSVGGRVAARPVEVGQRVSAGQLLAQLDDRELKNARDTAAAALAETEARLAQLEKDRQRVERLAASKAATAEELEQAAAAVDAVRAGRDAAEARLREARRMVEEARLTAPFAGTVSDVLLEPGEFAATGRTAVVISGDGEVEVEVGVPEWLVTEIREGDAVTVELPLVGAAGSRDASTPGRVRSLGHAAVGAGRLFPVVVDLEKGSERLVPGLTAEVVFEVRSAAAITVPLDSVLNPGGQSPAVFRLRGPAEGGGRLVERVAVEVEQLVGERVAVRGPLGPEDSVVVSGLGGLIDGQSVEVIGATTAEVAR